LQQRAEFDWIGAQNDDYRNHYLQLGARNVAAVGNIKYDGVNTDRRNPRTLAVRALLGIAPDALVWVAGSTQEPEESLAVAIYARARSAFPALRLILVPRHPERFDEVARLLERSGLPNVRRSALGADHSPLSAQPSPVILVDTIGELGAIWGLADVAFVGGSLDGKRGGQNMIEPSAYGAAVVFGPHTWNFKQTVADLLARGAAIETPDATALEATILQLLGDPALRQRLGQAARHFVLSQQGATERTLDALQELMGAQAQKRAA
jgi:3-deoxy-D-manno-octulosonic-acid transferase